MRAARAITSMCPLVTGSKEPEVKPMRFMGGVDGCQTLWV